MTVLGLLLFGVLHNVLEIRYVTLWIVVLPVLILAGLADRWTAPMAKPGPRG